ncbi:MAG: LacI family DNA-binding transcriptional regulator [Xanthomonadales bacterium]|jgi:DNA-binding LacI/PurR family transcriptional regulator|nr:LacI family DNA-binding transcriptional regulator [Xanthomonadales bacterium]
MAKRNHQVRKRVTSYDVARAAGVSQSAVSRAFRPGLSISDKTRDKVMKTAKKLGYRPNAIARMLISKRSGMIAVIISSISNLIYPELLSRITDHLSRRGNKVLLFTLDTAEQLENILDQLWTYRVDGVIALAAHFDHKDIVQFEEHDIPVVLYNRQAPDHPVNTVNVDHAQGVRQLVNHLVKAGNRRFLVLSGPTQSDVANDRREIALEQLRNHGFNDVPVLYGDYSYESGRHCFSEWMAEHDAPDAVICSNDTMAIGCIDEARVRFGLDVPGALSVVGFDGILAAFWSGYELTTVRQPVNQMAKASVDILMERIENPDAPPEKRVLVGTLIKGKTTRN